MRHHFIKGIVFAASLAVLTGCSHSTPPPAPVVSQAPPMTPQLAAAQQAKQAQIAGIKRMAALRAQIRARIQKKQ